MTDLEKLLLQEAKERFYNEEVEPRIRQIVEDFDISEVHIYDEELLCVKVKFNGEIYDKVVPLTEVRKSNTSH